MGNGIELRPGRTYILDDYTVVQVLDVTEDRVRYRIQARPWFRRCRIALRSGGLGRVTGLVRAEVNGDFFPDLVTPDLHRFERPTAESLALASHLAEQAARRPFAGGS